MAVRIAPSILAADLGKLVAEVREVVDAGVSVIHIDVMDGHFVPPLSMGPGHVKALRPAFPDAVLDVHLMVQRPHEHVAAFAEAGADIITFHEEADTDVAETIAQIRLAGCRAGVSVKPKTALEVIEGIDLDLCLIMSVEPGWGGQAFIEGALERIAHAREMFGADAEIEVDGGVDASNAAACAAHGASLLVAGSSIFGQTDRAAAYRAIHAAAMG
ncbi:MAG TPA: ribulose-phosphate 3-epimerase [Baekduia sp.]|nr:ribulose-phosphate 3-epimerase [Baekduia sp.]